MVAAGQQNWTGSFMESSTESKTHPSEILANTTAKVNKPVTKTKNLAKMNEQSTIFLYPSTDVLNVRACKKSYRNKKRHSTQDTEVRCSVENINLVNNLSV